MSTRELKINGEATQDETLSDNGGLKLAYQAYRRATNLLGTEPGLPHLEHYTPDQLFFITAANYFCEVPNLEHLKYIVENGSHPPNQMRVTAMMMNSPAFSEVFYCGNVDAMNPPDKCDVW